MLHRRASARVLTDVWREVGPDGKPYLVFRYLVIRLWKLPVEVFLNGPWAALPLVPLADVPSERLPEVVRAMDRRLRAEAPPADLGDIWTAALILIGLRLRRGEARQLLEGIPGMRESSAYQLILDEGRAEEARQVLFQLGVKRFGLPDEATSAAISAITDADRLEALILRVVDVASWRALLADQ